MSASFRKFKARNVISSRLPIGVVTKATRPESSFSYGLFLIMALPYRCDIKDGGIFDFRNRDESGRGRRLVLEVIIVVELVLSAEMVILISVIGLMVVVIVVSVIEGRIVLILILVSVLLILLVVVAACVFLFASFFVSLDLCDTIVGIGNTIAAEVDASIDIFVHIEKLGILFS